MLCMWSTVVPYTWDTLSKHVQNRAVQIEQIVLFPLVPSEVMQRLMSLVNAQQEERAAAQAGVQGSGAALQHGGVTGVSQQVGHGAIGVSQQGGAFGASQQGGVIGASQQDTTGISQQGSMSFSTLSTR